MRLSLEKGFDENQFRWCFWGASSGTGTTDDAYGGFEDDDAGTFGAEELGASPSEDRGSDDSDPFAGTVGIAAPKALPSGVVDYTSPNLIQSIISPRSVTVGDVTSYGDGINISPYDRGKVSFAGGKPTAIVDPLGGGSQILQMDMGRSPVGRDDRNFLEKAVDAITKIPDFQNQRAAVYDPLMDRYQTYATPVGDVTTLEKTSDNFLTDIIGNAINPFTAFTGLANTKTYMPLTGGEAQQYSEFKGGLLSGALGQKMVPYSELEARNAQTGGDNGSDQPLIIPQEVADVDPVTGEPTAFPTHTPREYKYQPYVGKFYSIPSRFTRPVSLLG